MIEKIYLIHFLFIALAYLMGSVSSAIVVCRLMRLPDPRTEGSGNPGTTNVLRVGGKKAAILTLLGDVLKGTLPVLIAKLFGIHGVVLAWVALATVVGHILPVFFAFKGGKGVATSFGAALVLNWPVALCCLGVWFIVVLITRYSSLAAVLASASVPLFIWLLSIHSYMVPLSIMSFLVLCKHQKNIRLLLKGQESKISLKKSM